MTEGRYATPEAFKQALEARLRDDARAAGVPVGRRRQLLIFDRFLARVFAVFGDRVVAKGGVVLELRLARARTTRDVDLSLIGDPAAALEALIRAGALDLGDRLTFRVTPDREHPLIEAKDMIYGGRRFRAEAQLAGKIYGLPFGVDVAAGDVLTVAPDVVEGSRFLTFAGVQPARLRIYPREAHVAEKLHAMTLPRKRPNSRVKDLPDLALLGQTGPFTAETLRTALERTFASRNLQTLPAQLPEPPPAWERAYAAMAASDDLPWRTLYDVVAAVRAFIDPVLAGAEGVWDPSSWQWRAT